MSGLCHMPPRAELGMSQLPLHWRVGRTIKSLHFHPNWGCQVSAKGLAQLSTQEEWKTWKQNPVGLGEEECLALGAEGGVSQTGKLSFSARKERNSDEEKMSGKGWKCLDPFKDLHPPWKGQGKGSRRSGNWRRERSKGRHRGMSKANGSRGEGNQEQRSRGAPWARGRVGGCQGNTRWFWKNKVKRLNPAFKVERNINIGICVPFWPGSGFKSSITELGYTANYKKKQLRI